MLDVLFLSLLLLLSRLWGRSPCMSSYCSLFSFLVVFIVKFYCYWVRADTVVLTMLFVQFFVGLLIVSHVSVCLLR